MKRIGLLTLALLAVMSAGTKADINYADYVPVGNAGNAADAVTGHGAVSYNYYISRYEVTNTQYAEFLNAKARTDPNALYNVSMASGTQGGITRSGSDGSYTYTVNAGFANRPVVYVSFLDAMRFTNWLNNGQGNGSTESGAYDMTQNPATVVHGVGAAFWVPTGDEWYKAAYYDPTKGGTGGYWAYPTQNNTAPTAAAAPNAAPNTANYNYAAYVGGGLSDVGSYSNSASYYNTFDQGGNAWEFNEDSIGGLYRGLRGGSWNFGSNLLNSGVQGSDFGAPTPSDETYSYGFRLASAAPEPSRALLMMAGFVLTVLRRRR